MEKESKVIEMAPFNRDMEDTIDLLDLARVLLHKWWILAISLILGVALAGLGTKAFMTPQYQATSMIYVYSKTTSITSLTDLQIGSQLAVDFQIVATTREVIENVTEKLGLDTTYEQMLQAVEIKNPQGSHILKITVTDPNPVRAAEISNTLADELRMRIADVMNTDEPSMVDRAVAPQKPSSPSVLKNAALGGLGCLFLAAAILTVIYLLDDTIKTEDDVRKYLNLNILAEIPADRTPKSAAAASAHRAKKKAG